MPVGVSDKVAALDLVAVRSHLGRLQCRVRWIPTRIQLADSLTKNDAEAIDLLRSCMRRGRYEICDEDTAMEARALEKERRIQRGQARKEKAAAAQKEGRALDEEKKDFWLNPSSKHYIAKIVRHAVDETRIHKIRVHQKPRSERMAWGECAGFPIRQATLERLTIVRTCGDAGGDKLGPVQEFRDNWGEVSAPVSGRWLGATVVLRR